MCIRDRSVSLSLPNSHSNNLLHNNNNNRNQSFWFVQFNLCLLMDLRFGVWSPITMQMKEFIYLLWKDCWMLAEEPQISLVVEKQEVHRCPLYICSHTRCIKYWLNILRMQVDRLPTKSCKMLYNMHCTNKNKWASSICFTLYRYGFGHVWENRAFVM